MKMIAPFLMVLAMLCSTTIQAQNTAFKFEKGKKIKVAFLVYDQVEALDLNGPVDILTKANTMDPVYQLYTVALTQEPLFMEGNTIKMIPTYSIANAPQADILIIPGSEPGNVAALCAAHPELLQWIQQQSQTAQVTMSVCTGGLILSAAGLLDGKAATTHFMVQDLLKKNPAVKVREGVRYVEDGKILTTAGITSGFDGALHLVEQINGKQIADKIARILIYNRNGDMRFMQTAEKK
ncbi:DJ-1/PfpI family protein [Chitinophaga nivalis]|uniref:DJ-1/PfpI family protein n=1 Tax=Chitinophaga nivalis TaxID=2991709 RepID=A0ABT3IIP9_9BACT|nr:DJ-1/PfpI family protein [Chitinophaga nivalis]MCW3466454.1 DJ-1/PfpI family protein [Chitinophaga nivalis]MCW3483855.1 DJ-1/PfpI family protein [Chitinophaga nivalis]